MPIKALPIVVDHDGFQRRSWEFTYQGDIYYVQEIASGYYLLKQTAEDGWQVIEGNKIQTIITAFEDEQGVDRTGLRG